ncbi:MAG: F0F1 ATP synthase subunit B [Gammaproteobacteria bacterium]|jgi:F-type H+-transporting ATPase subunit b|nr:F0F1 ATP synthase subunit B [Gammaproteobacteria bacterium]
MDINATLFGQMITFIIFVLFTMKYIWPPLMKVLEERRHKIAEGLAAAEKGHHDLELAARKIKQLILDAKAEASLIVDHANQRAHQIEEEARTEALEIIARMKKVGESEISAERDTLREQLKQEAIDWAFQCTEKLLHKNIDRAANEGLIHQMQEALHS